MGLLQSFCSNLNLTINVTKIWRSQLMSHFRWGGNFWQSECQIISNELLYKSSHLKGPTNVTACIVKWVPLLCLFVFKTDNWDLEVVYYKVSAMSIVRFIWTLNAALCDKHIVAYMVVGSIWPRGMLDPSDNVHSKILNAQRALYTVYRAIWHLLRRKLCIISSSHFLRISIHASFRPVWLMGSIF